MTLKKDIEQRVVDNVAQRIKKTSNVTSEQAYKQAREHAEKMNKERKAGGK